MEFWNSILGKLRKMRAGWTLIVKGRLGYVQISKQTNSCRGNLNLRALLLRHIIKPSTSTLTHSSLKLSSCLATISRHSDSPSPCFQRQNCNMCGAKLSGRLVTGVQFQHCPHPWNLCIPTSTSYEFEYKDGGRGFSSLELDIPCSKIECLVYLSFRRRILMDGCLRR